MAQIIQSNIHFDAIIAANDFMAIGALAAVREAARWVSFLKSSWDILTDGMPGSAWRICSTIPGLTLSASSA